MSKNGSRSARFIGKHRHPTVVQGDSVATLTDLKQLENLFKRWKSKPWSPAREHSLGVLSTRIKKARHHLEGKSMYSTLKRLK